MIETQFPEIEIETTIAVYLKRFHEGRIPLPMEVELCPIGLEAQGWRAFAVRILKEAKERERAASTIHIH